MIRVAALRGDERLLDAWRRGGFDGEVHSAFDRVVNLAGPRATLVSLAVRSLDDAPATVRVDIDRFGPLGLRPGMRAAIRESVLRVADARFAVALDRAASWRPALPRYPLDDAALRGNLAALRDRLGASRDPLLDEPSGSIAAALRAGDLERVRVLGRDLIGRGPGLTPSGDDFLVGLFAALNLSDSPCHILRTVCDDILADAEARTHAISIAALREAAQGRVRERIATLLREVAGGTPASTVDALDGVLAIGATSGRDLIAGILCGLDVDVALSTSHITAPRDRIASGFGSRPSDRYTSPARRPNK